MAPKRRLSDSQVAQLIEMRRDYRTIAEICEAMGGIDHQTYRNYWDYAIRLHIGGITRRESNRISAYMLKKSGQEHGAPNYSQLVADPEKLKGGSERLMRVHQTDPELHAKILRNLKPEPFMPRDWPYAFGLDLVNFQSKLELAVALFLVEAGFFKKPVVGENYQVPIAGNGLSYIQVDFLLRERDKKLILEVHPKNEGVARITGCSDYYEERRGELDERACALELMVVGKKSELQSVFHYFRPELPNVEYMRAASKMRERLDAYNPKPFRRALEVLRRKEQKIATKQKQVDDSLDDDFIPDDSVDEIPRDQPDDIPF